MSPVVRRQRGHAGELHALPMPAGSEVELWLMRPTAAAVVMGSAQKRTQFDEDRLKIDSVDLAERRSGGGAVFIDPAASVWIDVLAPRSSRWWRDDLVETFLEVGRAWQAAFASCGVETTIHDEAPERTAASSLACWASVGWGELTVGGTKIVGLSQRRTRWGARIQCMAVLDPSPLRIADYFTETDRLVVIEAMGSTEQAFPIGGVDARELETAVLTQLEAVQR